ncbi:MAG TPA: S1 RNA-binding domain-containing protein [bacterium]|nr:S1 RNA-binding domain-containing protein [bacterium]
MEVGSVVEGTVVDIVKFGAFVKIRGGKTGLVHISQISNEFVREVSDHVVIGAQVLAKVISIDDKGRVQLSLKSVTPEEAAEFETKSPNEAPHDAPRQTAPSESSSGRFRRDHHHHEDSGEDNFEKKLKTFLKQSEDRLVDVKRNIEAKRGQKKRKK